MTARDFLDRQLPKDKDAERALLGSILLQASVLDDVRPLLPDGDSEFSFEPHRTLWSILAALAPGPDGFDGVLLKPECEKRGVWDSLGGYDFLAGLISSVPSAVRAVQYAERVHECHIRRQLIVAAHKIVETVYEHKLSTPEIVACAQELIFAIANERQASGAVPLGELLGSVYSHFGKRGVSSGFFALEEMTNGFHAGELTIIAARPSMGKTALLTTLVDYLSLTEGQQVLLYSLEMTTVSVARRMVSARSGVASRGAGRSTIALSLAQQQSVDYAQSVLSKAGVWVDDASSLTIGELRSRTRALFRRHGSMVVMVDYLQLLMPDRREDREDIELGKISRGLKAMAKELDIPVLAAAQLNRLAEGVRPSLSHLRGSGNIEQDADNVIFLHRDKNDDPIDPEAPIPTEMVLAKQRNGPVGKIEIEWHKKATRFTNVGSPAPGSVEKPPPDGRMF